MGKATARSLSTLLPLCQVLLQEVCLTKLIH